MDYDVIIIGGSYAGLSAGLQLARARRSVLVVDAGQRRNRYAEASHGFLTQDGVPPGEVAAQGRAQLMDYPSVDWLSAHVGEASGRADGFTVSATDRTSTQVHRARRLILAGGVTDVLPDLPGLAERWGRQVFHCPYCHGYELHRGRIGVLAVSELSLHQALMLPDWGETTLFLDEAFAPDAAQLEHLARRGVQVVAGPVDRLEGDGLQLVLRDGRVFGLDGLFVATQVRPGALPAQLGCQLEDSPMGSFVRTDALKATTVPGVFACGDLARPAGSVALAVGDGAMAGVATHRSLMFGL